MAHSEAATHSARLAGATARALRAALGSLDQKPARRATDTPLGLVPAATAHGVQGWVLQRNLPAHHRRALEAQAHASLARYQRCVADLHVVHAALGEAGIRFLVVKGPALVVQYHGDPRLRDSVDLDLLVRPDDLLAALEALEAAGCELLDANWPLLARAHVHELRVLSPSGGPIDLHWSLGPGAGRDAFAPSADILIDRSRTIEIDHVAVRTLDWADTVVHLAVHAASSGGHRLIWCVDLRAALAQAPDNATELLCSRAEEWHARPALHLMLHRAQHSLGMPLSGDLLAALAPGPAWSGLVRVTEALAPVAGAGPGPSLTRIVARSARRDAKRSWRALASKGLLVLKRGGGDHTSPADLLNPDDPRSGLFPAGGAEGRAAFVAAVVSWSADVRLVHDAVSQVSRSASTRAPSRGWS